MIQNEREVRQQLVEEAARKIMIAARTAPKGKGVDVLEVCMLIGEEICLLSDEIDIYVHNPVDYLCFSKYMQR